jgi:hypothetical protein
MNTECTSVLIEDHYVFLALDLMMKFQLMRTQVNLSFTILRSENRRVILEHGLNLLNHCSDPEVKICSIYLKS